MKRSPYAGVLNLLTVLVLGMTLLFCLFAGATFVNPQVFFNPLKPNSTDLPALLPTVPTMAPTGTPVSLPTLPRTATLAVTARPTSSNMAPATVANTATVTVGPSATHTPFPTAVGPTATLTPSELPAPSATLRPPPPSATVNPGPQ